MESTLYLSRMYVACPFPPKRLFIIPAVRRRKVSGTTWTTLTGWVRLLPHRVITQGKNRGTTLSTSEKRFREMDWPMMKKKKKDSIAHTHPITNQLSEMTDKAAVPFNTKISTPKEVTLKKGSSATYDRHHAYRRSESMKWNWDSTDREPRFQLGLWDCN